VTTDPAALAWDGAARDVPTLHIDDLSAIPFLVDIAGVEEYQHRARLRAGDGDLFAAVTPAADGYERYCRDVLGLGAPELIVADAVEGGPLFVARACGEGAAFDRLVARAREAGGLIVHPYMSHEAVWELAGRISAASGTRVTVIGPTPEALWLANDKARFCELVAATVGDSWVVDTRLATDPDAIARELAALAARHPRVGLKRTRCASAMGNEVFHADEIHAGDPAALVRAFLARTEWPPGEEVLAVPWEDATSSPSTQLWIPPLGRGMPRLDGVYEQILEGPERVFVGSRPSQLPREVNARLEAAALAVGAALQQRGYTGRCSFDHLVVGDPHGGCELRFTEANGRWGGTSTPMSLLDRLLGGAARPPYRAQDFVHEALAGVSLPEILTRVGDDVFDPRTGRGRFVFYNVGPLAASGKLDVIAMGKTQARAEAALVSELPGILGV
jgi:hypothetical protein